MNPDSDPLGIANLNLPVFDVPQKEHWPMFIPLERVMAETEPQRAFYMKHYDSPEKRLRTKNPAPFIMHGPDPSSSGR
jgi:hypothetical protein